MPNTQPEASINKPKTRGMLSLLLGLILLTTFLAYTRLHISIIADFWPLSAREAANILNTEALLNPEAPAMYSWESIPEQTNLYGPLYPIVASPLAALFHQTPYFAHRLTNGLLLLISCGLLAYLIGHKTNRYYGATGALFFYAATVASPSIAAGPDILATLFYIGAIGTVHHYGFTRKAICLAAVLSFAGLLTKPYTVLVIPGMLTYGYLFISPKRALLAAAAIAASTLLGYVAISISMPAYYHSVFSIHSYYATRFFDTLIQQTWEFSYLQFAPITLFILSFPYQSLITTNRLSIARFYGDKPLFASPMGFDRFMTLAAAGVLFTFMGWHGGAYMIYFNHLLLPPLLIAALTHKKWRINRLVLGPILISANALLLLYLLPAPPQEDNYPELLKRLSTEESPILIDPTLEPLQRKLIAADLTDNSQAEYLINYDQMHKSPSQAYTHKWLEQETAKIESGHYKYLLLSNLYNRPHLLFNMEPTPPLTSRYENLGFFKLHVYHGRFRTRTAYGKSASPIFLFRRIEASEN